MNLEQTILKTESQSNASAVVVGSQFYREAKCALEAGVIDKFFDLDIPTRALIVAIVETRETLEFLKNLPKEEHG